MNIQKIIFPSILLVILLFTANNTLADWEVTGPTNVDPQNIVVVISENPRANPERTCLAVTLAKALALNSYRPQHVTIFATLDGSALGVEKKIKNKRFKCAQSGGPEISLKENLEQFLNDNPNNLVLCPLCFIERFGTDYDYGVLPGVDGVSPAAVIDLFANADKVLNF